MVSFLELMRVLMLTSVWPTSEHPEHAPFVVQQVKFLRKHGVDVRVLHVSGRQNPLAYLRAWREVRELLRKDPFDLIHAQWGQSALASLPSPLPLVVTFRGSDVQGIVGSNGSYTLAGSVLRSLSRYVSRVADEVILVAERLAATLPPRSVHVIPSGIDLERFQPVAPAQARRDLGLREDRRYVLFAASPGNPIKRFELAREAVSRLPVEACCELLVVEGIEPGRVPLYMRAADALLVTSLHEGSPNVVKEALASDLAVVSTDVGDVAQRISDVEGCFVCPPDASVLAARLETVLARSQRIQGRAAILDLDENALAGKVIGVYEQALARRKGRSHRAAPTAESR